MRSAVLALVLVLAAVQLSSVVASTPAVRAAYEKYLTQFPHKLLYSSGEKEERLAHFSANSALVASHNAEAAQGKHSFTLAMNQFGDWSNDEYRSTMLNLKHKSDSNHAFATYESELEISDLPASVDWRQKNVVTPVKDQGQCGSCWSFSASGAMEGAHALANGSLVSLSEQLLVDCVLGGADNCSAGGEMHDGYLYAISAGGEESEADYPYLGTDGHKCGFDKSKVVATFSSYLNVTSGDEAAMAAAIVDRPTISVGIDASSIWFQLYSTGVYDDSSCKNTWADLDHGVLVVGYGSDAASGKNYWIVKNSWAAIWGQQGYIWMVKDKQNQCGIATDATFPLV